MVITLNKDNWSGDGPYTQSLSIDGYTLTSKSVVSMQPTADQITQLIADKVSAITVKNVNGSLTAYAVGAYPSVTMALQCRIVETVGGSGAVWGEPLLFGGAGGCPKASLYVVYDFAADPMTWVSNAEEVES